MYVLDQAALSWMRQVIPELLPSMQMLMLPHAMVADEGRALPGWHEGAGAEEDCDALCPDAHEGDQPAGP